MRLLPRTEISWASGWGFCFCLVQILVCLVLAPHAGGLQATYLRLNQWDSFHYLDIVDRGYQVPEGVLVPQDVHTNRANAGYFPAFPILAQGFSKITGISSQVSLLLTAQVFAFLFWTQFLLLARIWGRSPKNALRSALRVALFPASFFLVMGYSESVFMASLLGVVLWLELWSRRTLWMRLDFTGWTAAFSGLLLSSSRLVGIPLLAYPIFKWIGDSRNQGGRIPLGRVFCIVGLASIGALGFFLYSYFQWGQWDIYLKLQRLGWGNEPNYWALLDPRSYFPKLFFEDTTTSVCKISNLAMAAMFFRTFRREKFARWNGNSLALAFSSCAVFFVCLSGKANYQMDSMIRYNLPVFTLLTLLSLQFSPRQLESSLGAQAKGVFGLRVLRVFGYLLVVAVQIWMILVITKGGWIA